VLSLHARPPRRLTPHALGLTLRAMAGQIRVAYVSGLLGALSAYGGSFPQLLQRAGFRPEDFADPERFVDLEKYIDLYERAALELDDDDLGLHLGNGFDFYSISNLYHGILSGPSVQEALRAVERYAPVHLEGARFELHREGETAMAVYRIDLAAPETRRQHAEAVMVMAIRLFRRLVGRRWLPIEVRFEHRRPRSTAEHQRILGAPLRFHQAGNAVVFDAADLQVRTPLAHRASLAMIEAERETWLDGVRKLVIRALPDGHPPINVVAQQLSMSVRTLQRRLAEHGLVYRKLIEEVRRELALHLLKDRSLDLTEIAFSVGYSELSAFDRAFRRWTGISPGEHRGRELGR
jgi:AraC-like DNA-binding protein